MQKTNLSPTSWFSSWKTDLLISQPSFPHVSEIMLCCFDLEQLLRGYFPLMLRWQNGDYILKCFLRRLFPSLPCWEGGENSNGNAYTSRKYSSDLGIQHWQVMKAWYSFMPLKWSKRLSWGRVLYPCLADVPLSCTEVFQSVHLVVGLKQYKIKSALSVGGRVVTNVWILSGNIHILH